MNRLSESVQSKSDKLEQKTDKQILELREEIRGNKTETDKEIISQVKAVENRVNERVAGETNKIYEKIDDINTNHRILNQTK